MTDTALIPLPRVTDTLYQRGRFDELRTAVLDGVAAENSKRNYALALDELAAFAKEQMQPISRALLLEFRATLLERNLSASTINVKLSAVRKLLGEAKRAGVIGVEETSQISDVPNIPQRGTRLGNWLTREQAKEPPRRSGSIHPQR